MRLVPLVSVGKKAFYEKIVGEEGEGVMLKDASAPYEQKGRPKCMQKAKRFEEVDAFVSGFDPGDEANGWFGLVGNLRMACYTEHGTVHEVAYPSNMTLEDRIDASACGNCGAKLDVKHDNVGGKRVILDIHCSGCGAHRPMPTLAKHWFNRVFEVRGQEWTSRVFRLKHATLERERVGADGKDPKECTISMRDIQARFLRAQRAEID